MYERQPTREHAIVQRIAHKRLYCDWPGCRYGHRIDPGETYEWDVRLGGGWERCYHLDCHRQAVHRPAPKEPPFRPGPPFQE